MSKAWYYNTISIKKNERYIKIYEVDYLGKTASGLSIVQFKKKIIDSYVFLITIGSKTSLTSSLIYHKKLDVAKAIIKDMFNIFHKATKWVL